MNEDILKATYNSKDCEFALQHGAFSRFRRDLTRGGHLFFPRKTTPGPGGGEYRYAHIAEMMIHLAMGPINKDSKARNVVHALARELQSIGFRHINDMPKSSQNEILSGGTHFTPDDYPVNLTEDGNEVRGTPRDIRIIVNFPEVFFSSKIISRDEDNPTFLIFDPSRPKDMPSRVKMIGNMSLIEAQREIVRFFNENTDNRELKSYNAERAASLPIINLTTLFCYLDWRLKARLDTQTIREF